VYYAIHISGYKNEAAITIKKTCRRDCYVELSTDITLNLTKQGVLIRPGFLRLGIQTWHGHATSIKPSCSINSTGMLPYLRGYELLEKKSNPLR